MRGDTLPAANEKSYERQFPRAGAEVTYPDGQIRRRVVLTEDISAGSTGTVNVMVPLDVSPYFEDGQVPNTLYIPSNGPSLSNGDEVWASWEPSARQFFLLGGPSATGATSVAVTTQIIPARSGTTPGGPITVTKQVSDPGGSPFADGATVDIYSWVKTPSADPADETDSKLFIYIAQDENGVWWFTGQDCTRPPTEQEQYYLLADQDVGLTLTPVNNTEFTLPTYEGFYIYTIEAEVDVSGVPGNQAWDVDIGLYDETDGAWLRAWDWAGNGNPLTNPRLSVTWAANVTSAIAGHTVQLYAIRNTTTGDVTLIGHATQQITGHELTGPFG